MPIWRSSPSATPARPLVLPDAQRRAWLAKGAAVGAGLLRAGAGLGLGNAVHALAAPAQPGEKPAWPPVRLLDGRPWSPQPGHATVVVFWSLTCAFCLRHNTRLDRLLAQAAGRPLQILTAVREHDLEGTRRHLARHGWRFDVTLDAGPLASVLSTRRLSPLTVTVDRAGRLLQVIPGEMSEDDILGLLQLAA